MAAALLIMAACADGADSGQDVADRPAPSDATTTTSTIPDGGDVPTIGDWLARDLSVDLGGGFTLTHCPGDAPVLCFAGDGGASGILELSSFPVATLDEVRSALPRGARAALEAHVEEYVGSLREDRVSGCGAGYTVTALPTMFLDGEEGSVVSYGFTGGRRGEPVTERTVQWAAIRGDDLVLLNLSGYDEGSCVPAEGEGTVADVVAVEPLLRPVVAANPLPMEVGSSDGG